VQQHRKVYKPKVREVASLKQGVLVEKSVTIAEIDPSFLITHKLPIEQAPHGYEIFKHKQDNYSQLREVQVIL
jgi:threonine dehydrogenase-like Zn-dependent dehydrogenase